MDLCCITEAARSTWRSESSHRVSRYGEKSLTIETERGFAH